MGQDVKESRLFQALLGKSEPPMPDLPPVTIRPITQMMYNLLQVTETDWGNYAFSREPLNGKFQDSDRQRLTLLSGVCGREYADKMISLYHTYDPVEMAEKMGLTVEYPELPSNLLRVLFAEYKPKKHVYLYMDAVHKAEEALLLPGMKQIMGGALHIKNLLLAHEMFHHVEEVYAKEIFTRTEKVELWAPPLFHNRSGIFCLGEIAAMEFARSLNQLDYSPFILDVFLVYGYSHESACRLYEEIMEISGLDPDGINETDSVSRPSL